MQEVDLSMKLYIELKSAEEDGVVSVFENTKRKLHTTRSWDFVGMPVELQQRNPKMEKNIIMGFLDTGTSSLPYTQLNTFVRSA